MTSTAARSSIGLTAQAAADRLNADGPNAVATSHGR
jgi:hypothetical protein